ncbi:MAG: hypothetical protein IAF38_03845 [Bacteroidia bacterium]|nr:hypothetical protein [Bacteroidia bacterium]
MNQNTNYISEIEKKILKNAGLKKLSHNPASAAYLNTKFKVAGLNTPFQRGLSKEGFSFSGLKAEEQIKIWDSVFHEAEFHEIKSQALFLLKAILKKQIKKYFGIL